ncbi:hypothetical protein OQ496_13275, partial [Acetobacter suratthaniensis]|uniref:hypothetical protein n=1 Tax=Acetobacter suratthaniensis TaxID=1502841 RepID=UPI002247D271
IIAPNLLKTQSDSHLKNRQSNRQKPEITRLAHQSTVLRSLQVRLHGPGLRQRHPVTDPQPQGDGIGRRDDKPTTLRRVERQSGA